jgi:hypothetical protein
MHRLWCFIAVAVILASPWRTVAAQEGGLTMAVTVGFDGYCREGGWCPVHVVLSNQGADLEGELQVFVPRVGPSDQLPHQYARRVVLPALSRKAYSLIVPSGGQRSELTVRVVAGNRVLASQTYSLRALDPDDLLVGIVSSDPSALNFLGDLAPPGAEGASAHLALETLPPEPLGWTDLDVLVFNDVDTTDLDTGQRAALATWLSSGGHLIVGGGAGAAQTAAGLTDVLPAAVRGVRTVERLDGLGAYVDAPVASGPYPLAEVELTAGEALVEQSDLILVARRPFGAGAVDLLAFDAGLNAFRQWEANAEFWGLIVEPETARRTRPSIANTQNALNAVGAVPGLKPPSVLQIVAFLLAYTILIGPVNYLVLRKLDRRELAWFTIPLLVLGFTAFAYASGFQIRGRVPILHRLGVVTVPQGTNTGYATELVGLFSPRRARYDVQAQDAGVRSMTVLYSESSVPSLHVFEEGRTWTLSELRADIGDVQSFLVEGYVETDPPEVDLEVILNSRNTVSVAGTVRNGALPLTDAVLLVGRNEHPLGDLEAGELVSQIPPSGARTLFREPWDYVPGLSQTEQYRRLQLVGGFFPNGGLGLPTGIYLAGWSDQAPLEVALEDRVASTSDLVLYIFELPVTTVESEGSTRIPPELIRRWIEERSGFVDESSGGLMFGYEASVVLRFAAWSGAELSWVEGLALGLEPLDGTDTPPIVHLWNWQDERWEPVSATWGDNAVPNPQRYVSPDYAVRVRLGSPPDGYVQLEDVTITIEGQR